MEFAVITLEVAIYDGRSLEEIKNMVVNAADAVADGMALDVERARIV